jgi:large subunit ribosomal protein L31
MRKDIHPTYYTDAQVICSCGNTWTTGSTKKLIRTDVLELPSILYCEQRIVDSEGQVDRFYKKLHTPAISDDKEARESARTA